MTPALLFAFAATLAAQTPDGVNGFASRTVVLPADEAIVEVQANVVGNVSLDSLLETLAPMGVRREHLASVSAGPGASGPPPLTPTPAPVPVSVGYRYSFFLRTAPAAVPDLLAKLNELQRTGGLPPGSILASGALSTSAGAVANARTAALPGLYADARRREAAWRQAAGLAASAPVAFLSSSETQTGRLVGGGFPFPFVAEPLGTTVNYSLGLRTGEGARTVGVTASHTVLLAPERIIVRVTLNTDLGVTTEAVLEYLGDAGFVLSDVESVTARSALIGQGPGGVPIPNAATGLTYQLTSTQPAEYADSILQALARLQRTPPRGVIGVSFNAGMNVSSESIAALRENVLPILVEQARGKAASLAQVAGWRLGSLLSITDAPGGIAGGVATGIIGALPPAPSNLRIATSVSVQFSAE